MRHIVAKRYGWITAVSFLLTVAAIFTIATRWNIDSNLNTLLPQDSPAALAMEEVAARVGAGSSLFVVIDSPDKQANLDYAAAYSQELRAIPEIALAHYHNDKQFFEEHKLLYMQPEDIAQLRERVERTIAQRKREANPLFVGLKRKKKKQELTTADLERKYAGQMAASEYREYLFSEDGYALTIIVRFVESSTDLNSTNALIDKVKQLAQKTDPESFHKEMTVDFGGSLASRQAQYKSIVDDIQSSALFTIVGLFLLLSLYFRRPRAVFVVFMPLLMSVAWTLALAFLVYGQLTAITIFIFAILLGLGIDFAIHILHGYDRGRHRGLEPVEALVDCAKTTGLATSVGGMTTLATFLVLTMASFKSLSQFGVVASLGVLTTLVATLATLPALTLLFQQWRPLKELESEEVASRQRARRDVLARWITRLAPITLILSALITLGLGVQARHIAFEENFYRFGDFYWPWEERPDLEAYERTRDVRLQAYDAGKSIARSAEAVRERMHPESYERERKQKTTGQKYTSALQNKTSSSPTFLLFDDAEQTRLAAERAKQVLRERAYPSVGSFSSIYDFMPGSTAQQQERMVEITKLKGVVDELDVDLLSQAEQERIAKLKSSLAVDVVQLSDLPDWTKRFFKEAGKQARPAAPGEEFSYEYVIVVSPRQNALNGPEARRFLDTMEEVFGPASEQHFRLASQAYVYTTMLDEIKTDGLRMISIALVVVLLILILSMRSLKRALLAITPLAVGSVWMFGICTLLHLKLDFFNIIILPALIGIGVDDGVHFTMRYFELGRGSLPEVMRDVGSAIFMTSVTSLVGFGGLAITDYGGLQSLGTLAIVGIFSAFSATLLVLPSLLWLLEKLSKPAPDAHTTH